MAGNQVVKLVEQLALPIVQAAGMELVDVEFVKEGGRWYLRIFIDKPEGINHADCRFISEKLDHLLDAHDPVPHAYALEVSSPGIERPLKRPGDFNRFAGMPADITTYQSINGLKKFNGRLQGTREDGVVIELKGEELLIPFEQIASARLAGEFNCSGRK
ncbi:MAG: Ribosome maturation factor RimP [Pelotomaculum sp. PtaB.Bin104]|nr:MAG: Ribosome maturation factor RimP [Pelotomaculum sp. PtaB.Bin104]